MKKLGILAMVLGILSTLSSTIFTAIDDKYDLLLVVFYWGILSGFEFFFAWVYLLSNSQKLQYLQKLTLVALIVLTSVWITLVINNADAKSIFTWALKILNFSGLYFMGLYIYYRGYTDSKNS